MCLLPGSRCGAEKRAQPWTWVCARGLRLPLCWQVFISAFDHPLLIAGQVSPGVHQGRVRAACLRMKCQGKRL